MSSLTNAIPRLVFEVDVPLMYYFCFFLARCVVNPTSCVHQVLTVDLKMSIINDDMLRACMFLCIFYSYYAIHLSF